MIPEASTPHAPFILKILSLNLSYAMALFTYILPYNLSSGSSVFFFLIISSFQTLFNGPVSFLIFLRFLNARLLSFDHLWSWSLNHKPFQCSSMMRSRSSDHCWLSWYPLQACFPVGGAVLQLNVGVCWISGQFKRIPLWTGSGLLLLKRVDSSWYIPTQWLYHLRMSI